MLIGDLKRDARTRDIPIVVLTSDTGRSVRAQAKSKGYVAVVIKPCLPEILADTLRGVLVRGGGSRHL